MYLLMTAAAAVVATLLWRKNVGEDRHDFKFLSLVYWGAALMWLMDVVMVWPEEGLAAVEISLDASLLGLASVALGLLLWGVRRAMARRTVRAQ